MSSKEQECTGQGRTCSRTNLMDGLNAYARWREDMPAVRLDREQEYRDTDCIKTKSE